MTNIKESSPTSVGNAATLTTSGGLSLDGEQMLLALLLHCTKSGEGRGGKDEEDLRRIMNTGEYYSK